MSLADQMLFDAVKSRIHQSKLFRVLRDVNRPFNSEELDRLELEMKKDLEKEFGGPSHEEKS
jgi:hypothetical protein